MSPNGYNLNEGGSGNTHSEETRKKNSESQKKRYADPAAHKKLSIAQRKRFEDPAEHEKLSIAQKKYFSDPAARKKSSEAKKNPTPQASANMSAGQKRRFFDPEARAKKAEDTTKYFEEHPEAREHLAELNRGKKPSAETLAKRSASLRLSWQLRKKAKLREEYDMQIFEDMQKVFKDKFGQDAAQKFFSPGRVNLIGEHLDYVAGVVFPCAISLGTYALVSPRVDSKTRIYSMNLADKGVIEFDMHGLKYNAAYDWANYVAGTIATLEQAGHSAANGFDIVIYGTLPAGAGLSSSASLEVLTAVILNENFNFGIDMIEMVKLSQKAENEFVGMNCGIMDQFAVGMGKKDCAILLDCNTLKYRYSPIKLGDASIVITNTNKPHSLVTSAYNERRKECENALRDLQTVKPELKALCELTNEEFDEISSAIKDPIEKLRARHAVRENQRTLEGVKALEANDLERFGQLMHDSHVSLCEDYDVTGVELDTLAELAWTVKGCIGSRMTGAGFGGSTVSIVKNDAIEDFKKTLENGYTKKIGYAPSFYVADISDGTHKVD